ncbi:MAG: ABC transporter permease [Methanomassiliicoccales archaeon]|nr:ABC transporter permease [Methanomassiliicoccales archaeon]
MENANVVNNRERLPSDLQQVMTVAKYDVLKHLRSRRLLGLMILEALLLGLTFGLPILLGADAAEDPADYMSSFVGWADILIVIGATMFAGDAIVSEFQSRTGYLLFPNPVKRFSIFIGKYLSTLGIIVLMLLVYYGIAALLTLIMTGGGTVLALYSMLFACVYGAAAAALGFLISSIFKGSTGSLVLTFFALLMILPLISQLLPIGEIKPWFMLTFCGSVISYIMIEPYPMDSLESIPLGNGEFMEYWSYYPEVGVSLAVLAVYVIVCLGLGMYLFRRREMVS